VKFISFRTPSQYVNQSEYDSNPYQQHKSFIPPEFFIRKGYRVYGADGPLFLTLDKNKNIRDISFLLSVISYLLRPIYLFLPAKSLNYIAIKVRN